MALIRPCYYKGERGNKPYDLERMLRIYMIQNLYNLSDMATVAEVIAAAPFRTSAALSPATRYQTETHWADSAIC